jgi:hypothetical protein
VTAKLENKIPVKRITVILNILALIASGCGRTAKKMPPETVSAEILYRFENFPVKIYDGNLLTPDFNNDPYASSMGFVESMTQRCEEEGINFGGRFTILQGSCGMGCTFIIMADRKSGQFVTVQNPDGYDEELGAWGYEYRADSELLIANSYLLTSEKDEFYNMVVSIGLMLKFYVWKNNEFVLLE